MERITRKQLDNAVLWLNKLTDSPEECRGYIQHWLAGNEITDKSAQKIFGTAEKILKAGRAAAETIAE